MASTSVTGRTSSARSKWRLSGSGGLSQKLVDLHPGEERSLPGDDDERAVRLGQGQPMLEVRRRAQRPVLVVELRPLHQGARVDHDRVHLRRGEDRLVARDQIVHVRQVGLARSLVEVHGR